MPSHQMMFGFDHHYGRSVQERRMLKFYGLTLARYEEMLESQQFRCAICRRSTPTQKGWQIDHCHTSGVVRGILCSNCNMGLGQFKDDADTLVAAAEYVAGWELTTSGTAEAMSYVDDIRPGGGHRRHGGQYEHPTLRLTP